MLLQFIISSSAGCSRDGSTRRLPPPPTSTTTTTTLRGGEKHPCPGDLGDNVDTTDHVTTEVVKADDDEDDASVCV